MPRRGENIRKRKDGRWEARYRNGSDSNGAPIYSSVYGKTYKEVKEKKQQSLSVTRCRTVNSSLNFFDVQKLWIEHNSIHLKAATERKYMYLLQRHILPEFGSIKINQITASAINAFLTKKIKNGRLDGKGGLSAAYVRSIMLVISSIMLFAVSEKYCPPLSSNICKPTAQPKETQVLSPLQQKKLESAISENPSPTAVGIFIALYAGLRIGEICALSWNDIDLDNKLITVRHTISRIDAVDDTQKKSILVIDSPKTQSSYRVVPICSKLNKLLKEANERKNSQFVVSTTERFVSPRTFEYRFHAILKKHHIQDIHFHGLRHSFATRCIEQSVDVKTLSQILGHASESITLKTYVHSSLEMKRMQIEKLG